MNQLRKNNRTTRGASRAIKVREEKQYLNSVMKTLKLTFGVAMLVGCAYGAFAVAPKLSPEVEKVVVEGDFQYLNEAELADAIYKDLTDGMLGLDIADIQRRISQVPWVGSVEVIRQFPSTLVISIVEEQAIAQWNSEGYISREGDFIQSVSYEALDSLPQLSSEMANLKPEEGARQAIELFHLLNSAVLVSGESISELQQSNVGGWSMVWNSGLKIDLGRMDHLNRTRHALAAWQRLPLQAKEKIERIDARYDNGVAVRKRAQIATEQSSGAMGSESQDNPASAGIAG